MENDKACIDSILMSIFLCMLKIAFFAEMSFWVVMLPIIADYGVRLLVSLILIVLKPQAKERQTNTCSNKNPIHWDYKTKRMIEDPQGDDDNAEKE